MSDWKNINNVLLFQIERTSKIARQYSQRDFDRLQLGITVDQWILLKIIDEAADLSQRELAQRSERDPASITRSVDLLEKKQLLQRDVIPGNRRQYRIQLTEKGKSMVADNRELILQHRAKSVEGFSPEELTTLHDLLTRMQNNLR